MTTTHLKIGGMTCGHCVSAVEKALRGQAGVERADVRLQDGEATVEYDGSRLDAEQLVAAVAEEGYTAEVAG